ncbi:MAG: hypothetical protein JST49_08770 [Bacteroidetes bacterium]|nr:hypothetical protein [Bacteroidota bacterium]
MQTAFVIICLGVLLYSFSEVDKQGFRDENLIHLAIGIVGLILVVFQEQILKLGTPYHQRHNCTITAEGFLFPNGYPFQYGYMRKRKLLDYIYIDEIRISTYPPTAIVNENETIFLLGLTKEDIEANSEMLLAPITKPQDNWELICNEFLDTEFDEEFKKRDIERLTEAGIYEEEVQAIRSKIKAQMMFRTYATWDWVYYGQYHVLDSLRPLNKKKYWWTMDIALRQAKQI